MNRSARISVIESLLLVDSSRSNASASNIKSITNYKPSKYKLIGDWIRPIICGVDPGSTVGLAFLDINGVVTDIESGKNLSVNDVIYAIEQRGDLLVIASDRTPLPQTIKKIAAAFSCKIYYPDKSLTHTEKEILVKNYHGLNNHERDALAAALKAYNFFSHKFRQIKKQEGPSFEKNIRTRLKIRKGKRF